MFIHFSIMMIIFKKKSKKFDQKIYDIFFYNIENNLRELGFGDVSVNKKMKDLNKVLYDILLKIEVKNEKKFMLNHQLILTYFNDLNDQKSNEYLEFNSYFVDFFNFCYELSLDNMVEDAINFRK
jgi:cytochrome b pre-mRNA-processing protein 3